MEYSVVQRVEIEPGIGCKLETTSEPKATPDCMKACKMNSPACVAYSYNSATTKCTIVTGCLEVLYKISSNADTYRISITSLSVLSKASMDLLLY